MLAGLLFCTAAVSAEIIFEELSLPDLPPLAPEIRFDDEGHIEWLVVSEWTDRVVIDGERVYYNYRQGYDYLKREGFIQVHDLKGNLVRERSGTDIGPGVSREELLVAFDVIKQDPAIRTRLEQANGPVHLHGGFNFSGSEGDSQRECRDGMRCVRVMASTETTASVIHSVVRLNDRTVVFLDYDEEYKSEKLATRQLDQEK